MNIVATTLLAAILLCVGLFWARWLCSMMRVDLLPQSAHQVTIYPSGEVQTVGDEDPNLLAPPALRADMTPHRPLLLGLGALHYFMMRIPWMPAGPRPDNHVYRWEAGPDGERIYFDPSLGLIVCEGTEKTRDADKRLTTVRHFTCYAGPEGASRTPDERLGRFLSPIADTFQIQPQVVYDRDLGRFFSIDWREGELAVRKGPELAKDGRHQPVQIGWLQKDFVGITIPKIVQFYSRSPTAPSAPWEIRYRNQVLVLDASGRIDLLDTDTFETREAVAHLPMPRTLLGSRRSVARPEDVAAYDVAPLWCLSSDARGLAVATVSREGLGVSLAYFDANGVPIAGEGSSVPHYVGDNDRSRELRGTDLYVPSAPLLLK